MARRTVQLNYSRAGTSTLAQGPQYTIQEDAPWLQTRSYSAGAAAEPRASSTYSVQLDDIIDGMESIPSPLSATEAEHTFAHPRQEISDAGPQTRSSRLPIFRQVRSMLTNNRSPASPTASAIKWDEYSGEISEHGKEARVKPSTYKSPYEGILKPRRTSPSRNLKPRRDASPVSMLVDEDLHMLEKEPGAISPPSSRPVSPISTMDVVQPLQLEVTRPKTAGDIKRKPVASSQSEDLPSVADMRIAPNSSHGASTQGDDPSSRFSWTTLAHSEAPRKSTDTRFSRQNKSDHDSQYNSHFSWSTVASAVPPAMREQTPPPSPPPVPVQYLEAPTYPSPPTQSILSRQRPLKKIDKPEWGPPATPVSEGYVPRNLTPKVYRIEEHPVSTTPSAEGKKRLPLPPLFTEKSLSHLEALLTQEKNIVMQRRNIEKSITDLERIEKASPLEVSFAAVREAKKKLGERRHVLDEVRMEEMDIGIRIARARRKEDFGDGEGTLWVRRVTG